MECLEKKLEKCNFWSNEDIETKNRHKKLNKEEISDDFNFSF